jgi:hypothetical protein
MKTIGSTLTTKQWCWNFGEFCPQNSKIGQNYTRKKKSQISQSFLSKKAKICYKKTLLPILQ